MSLTFPVAIIMFTPLDTAAFIASAFVTLIWLLLFKSVPYHKATVRIFTIKKIPNDKLNVRNRNSPSISQKI